MRAIRAWVVGVGIALTLALGCAKHEPHEPRLHTMADCGDIVDLVEVEGHLYGWTKPFDSKAPTQACAFDIDARGWRLRFDRHMGPESFTDMLVEPDGSQIFAMWKPADPFFVRLFRRDGQGMRELDELRVDGLTRPYWTPFELLETTSGPALLAFTMTWPHVIHDHGSAVRAWQAFDTRAEPLELALPSNSQLFHEAGTIVAVAVHRNAEWEVWATPHVGASFTVSALDELGEGAEAIAWTRRVTMLDERDSSIRDAAGDGEHVFILGREQESWAPWLACLTADDGELLWTAPIELGTLDPQAVIVGMRAKDEGIVVALFGLDSDWTVVALAVSPTGEQTIVGRRAVVVPRVTHVEPAADASVWLAGDQDDDAWVARIELR